MGTSVPSTRLEPGAPASVAAPAGTDRDRLLPVVDRLASILPDGGLVRGRTVACVGSAAPTVALTLVARATAEGSWLAVVGLPWLGAEAAREMGVALERVVAVDVDPRHHRDWAECVAAAVVGFDVVLAAPSGSVPERLWRQVRARLQARGGVLVTLPARSAPAPSASAPSAPAPSAPSDGSGDDPGAGVGADLVLAASTEAWEGIGRGHGHLAGRRLRLTVTGRRTPRPRTAILPAIPPPANPVLTTSAFAG